LFFHSGVWWVCRQLTLEREIACDDCVLEKSTPRSYALLLATLAGRMQGSPALLAPGVSTNRSQLQQRIDMILDTHRNTSLRVAKTRLGLVTSAAACLALAAIYTAPRIVFAQSQGVAAAGVPATAPVPAPAPPLGAVTATPGSAALAGETIAVDEPLPPVAPATSAGPRYKTLTPVPATPALSAPAALPPRGVIALTPAPGVPAPPMALVAPTPATPPLAVVGNGGSGGLTAVYGTAPQPRRKDTSNMSVEERLNRLERMIESLSAKKEFRVFQPNDFKWEGQWKMNGFDEKQLQDYARAQADMAKRQVEMARKQLEIAKQNAVDPKEIEKLKEQIERETARAGEEIKRATRDMERAMREQQQQHPRTPEARNALPRKRKMDKDAKGQQLEGLRRQHEALERQMERLDRQIEELEQSREELEQQDEENEKESADLQGFPKGAQNDIEVAVQLPKPECTDSKNVNVNADVKADVNANVNVTASADIKPKR